MSLLQPLTKVQEQAVLADVGYTEQQLEQDLKQLREWLELQEHLPPSRLKEKDCFLKTYLIGCKGSLETAKRKLDAYYTFRRHSDLFASRDPLQQDYKNKNESCYTCFLPRLSRGKELVMVNIPIDQDPKNYNYLYNMRRIIHIIEMKMRMPEVLASSICFIIDAKKFTPAHVILFTPGIVRDMLYVVQNILPLRMKGLIFVNAPTFMEIALNNLIKPFLSKKLKDRFQVFSNGHEEFCKFVERSVLPKELDGDEPVTLKELTESWVKKEITEREWFLSDLSEHTDESKRVNLDDCLVSDPYFGVYGSLKKLVVD